MSAVEADHAEALQLVMARERQDGARAADFALAEQLHSRVVGAKSALREGVFTMLTVLIIVLLLALLFGGLGHGRYGYAGWSPAGLVLIVLLVMLVTGYRL